jgi:hypothetical protein
MNVGKRNNIFVCKIEKYLIFLLFCFTSSFLKYLKDNKAWVNTTTVSNINAKTTSEYQELTSLFDQIKISKDDDGKLFLSEKY